MQAGDALALELLTDIGGTINVQPSRLSHRGTPQMLQPPNRYCKTLLQALYM